MNHFVEIFISSINNFCLFLGDFEVTYAKAKVQTQISEMTMMNGKIAYIHHHKSICGQCNNIFLYFRYREEGIYPRLPNNM